MVTPTEFISAVRGSDTYIEIIYTNGGCYQFHKIMKLLFPGAVPLKVKSSAFSDYNHIITEIDGKYYDITGEVKATDFWGIEGIDNEELDLIENWSFARNNWLYKMCPECGAEVVA